MTEVVAPHLAFEGGGALMEIESKRTVRNPLGGFFQ